MKKNNSTKIPFPIIMLGLVSLFTDSASEMIYPLVPIYVSLLGSGPVVLGIIEGVAETTAAMLKLISGIISDKLGKRKFLVLIGYSLSSFTRPFIGLVSRAWEIIIIRMFDRIGKGIRTAPRDALIADSTNKNIRGKAYGFHRSMDHLGAVLGPCFSIIALLFLVLWLNIKEPLAILRWIFILSIFPGILAVITVIFFVKEINRNKIKSSKLKFSIKNINKNFRNYLLILVLFTLGNSSDAFLLFRAQEALQESGATIKILNGSFHSVLINFGSITQQKQIINILFLPLVWSFFHIIKAIFSTYFGALSDKLGRKLTINVGWTIYAFVYFSFALLVFFPVNLQIVATFILFAIYALFYAFTEGPEKAFVADLVKEEHRGSAFGLYNFAIGLSALPASVLFGFLYSFFNTKLPGFGGTVAFGFGGTLALVSSLLLTILVKEPRSKSKK